MYHPNHFFSLLWQSCFKLKFRVTDKERDTVTAIFHHCFTLQAAAMAGAKPEWSVDPSAPTGSPTRAGAPALGSSSVIFPGTSAARSRLTHRTGRRVTCNREKGLPSCLLCAYVRARVCTCCRVKDMGSIQFWIGAQSLHSRFFTNSLRDKRTVTSCLLPRISPLTQLLNWTAT